MKLQLISLLANRKKTIIVKQFILAFIILIFECCTNSKQKSSTEKAYSTINKRFDKIYIQDESSYSKAFLNDLKASDYPDSIKLIDNYIIVKNDTITFPNDLDKNKKYTFKAIRDNQQYTLIVERINETTLHYDLHIYKNDKLIFAGKDEANLNGLFFLGAEMDEDDITGEAYGSTEYWKKSNDYWLSIRVGMGKDNKNRLRAKITLASNNKQKMKFELHNCPTLRTE